MHYTISNPQRSFPSNLGLYDYDLEKNLLSALISDPDIFDNHTDWEKNPLTADELYFPVHQAIFRLWTELKAELGRFNPVIFAAKAEDKGLLETIGGRSYIAELIINDSSTIFISLYSTVEIIKNKAARRAMIIAAEHMIEAAYNPNGEDATALAVNAYSLLDNLVGRIYNFSSATFHGHIMCEQMDSLLNPVKDMYVPTGFTKLDQKLKGGLKRGTLNVIAARPGMGKTAFGVNILTNISLNQNLNKPVLFFSLEMTKGEIVLRNMAKFGRADTEQLENCTASQGTWLKIVNEQNKMYRKDPNGKEFDMFILDDNQVLSPAKLKAAIKKSIRLYGGVSAVLIDYYQLMHSDKNFEVRFHELTDISTNLKAIATELNVPIVVLAQLNTEVERRPNKRPIASDIGECNKIVNSADTVMLLYREEYYNPTPENSGKATLILAKNRSGQNGDIALNYEGQYFTFTDA